MGENKPTTEVDVEGFHGVNGIKEELNLMLKNEVKFYMALSFNGGAQIRGQPGSNGNMTSQLGLVSKMRAAIFTAFKAAIL